MIWQKIVRLVMKIVIAFITLSVALTSIVGGISMILIVSDIDNNFQIDESEIQANFGAAGNNISFSLDFTNDGYFAFENFTISLNLAMENKTSGQNITFLDRELYQNTLQGKNSYHIELNATGEYFNNQSLLDDMGGFWHDPEIEALIASNSSLEPLLRPLSFPYILNNYDVGVTLSISSAYNLGLISFGLDIEFSIIYADYFLISYDQWKQNLKDDYGL
ncbi:MAG: hypothetical protein ACTSPA_04475 [Promethearchaeota archaeon]